MGLTPVNTNRSLKNTGKWNGKVCRYDFVSLCYSNSFASVGKENKLLDWSVKQSLIFKSRQSTKYNQH
jgi:hypothetical protein